MTVRSRDRPKWRDWLGAAAREGSIMYSPFLDTFPYDSLREATWEFWSLPWEQIHVTCDLASELPLKEAPQERGIDNDFLNGALEKEQQEQPDRLCHD